MKIAIYSDFDSRVKWGISVCANILKDDDFCNSQVDLYYKSFDDEYFKYYGVKLNNVFEYQHISDISANLCGYDLIVLALGGTENLHTLMIMDSLGTTRPVVISGFNGLTDGYDEHGLLCRYGSDIICVNSLNDMIAYQKILRGLKLNTDCLVLTGLQRSYLNSISSKKNLKKEETWLFVEQIGIPDTLMKLEYLVLELAQMARLNPTKKILVKCRQHRGFINVNFQDATYDLKIVWSYKIKNKPENVFFIEEDIENILSSVDLCFSFTSTVLLEALALDIPVAVLSDFGVGKQIGNHVFIGSDLLCSMNSLSANNIPTVNQIWLANNLCINASKDLHQKIKLILNSKIISPERYYSNVNYPFYYFKKIKSGRIRRWFLYRVHRFWSMFK